MQTLVFHVRHTGEPAAGMIAFSETITITAEHDFGGAFPDIIEHFRQSLAEYWEGARVLTEHEFKAENDAIYRVVGEPE